jgi:CheY-like chemotaxis protein
MGYDLTVESEVGKGTTFKIAFPKFSGGATPSLTFLAANQSGSKESDEKGVTTATAGSVAGDGDVAASVDAGRRSAASEGIGANEARGETTHYKVLVIDDDPDSLVLMEDYLADFGCEVLQASSGRVGLEMARTHKPDLVTLDLHMPDIDGWEVLRTLKAEPEVAHIPVVIASVAANEGRGRLFGAVDLLTKPIERSDLLRVLWRQLVNQHGRRVLLVDDDTEVQTLLKNGLAVDDLDVHCVSNGEEALLFLERDTPAAVLLDLRMPVMDGFEFLDRMRESRYHKGLPVIVITVKRLTPEEEAQLEDKASAVVLKDEHFVPRVRAFLTTLFPMESRKSQAEPIAD